MSEFIILAIPFIGTSLGSAMVFFLKKRIAPKFEKMLLGFAAGVMIAASVWSLLIPSIDMSKGSSAPEWLAALVGFLAGITATAAMALAIGIAIQNFPEGAIISMPLCSEGMSKKKAFICGVLSGVVEPVGGFITILIAGIITPVLPYLLSFAAGAMMYVVIEELIPESQNGEHSNIGTIGAAVGFALMMVLDIALG